MNNLVQLSFTWKILSLVIFLMLITGCGKEADDKALGIGQLKLEPSAHAITLNGEFQYTATFLDSRGNQQENVDIEWFSSDESIATISTDGTVVGISAGQVNVTAQVTTADAGQTNSNVAKLTVSSDSNAVAKVEIVNTETAFLTEESLQLIANVSRVDGTAIADANIIWFSHDETVATVNDEGVVLILAAGMVVLTATVDGIDSPDFILTGRVENNSRVAAFQRAAHSISGTGVLQVNSEGNLEVVFSDDFSVDDGPGLEVFLSNSQTPDQTSINLGSLNAITGSQTYAVPNNVMINDFEWVVIHCVPYNIVFGRGQFL